MTDSTAAAGTPTGAPTKKLSSNKKLGIISLAMINVAAFLSLRSFPTMAMEGWVLRQNLPPPGEKPEVFAPG